MYLDDDVGVPGLPGGHHRHRAFYHVQLTLQFELRELGLYEGPHLPDVFLPVLGKQSCKFALLLHPVGIVTLTKFWYFQSPCILHRT